MGGYGAPGEIRTPDLLLRRQPLYPAELRAHTSIYSLHGRGKSLQSEPGLGASRFTLDSDLRADHSSPGLHTKLAPAGQRCRKNEPRLLGGAPAGTVRSK